MVARKEVGEVGGQLRHAPPKCHVVHNASLYGEDITAKRQASLSGESPRECVAHPV